MAEGVSVRYRDTGNWSGAAVITRSDLSALITLTLVWSIMWAMTGPVGDFPLNDDWVYGLAVRSILETGRFSLPSPSSANVIAQAYWGALFCLPFGFSFTALRISTFVLGTFGVLSFYLLLRELGGARAVAFLGAMTLAANPIYLQLSDTFMTDVPFTGLFTASLWLHVRGVRRRSTLTTGLAFGLALVAVLIRQFGLALPAAFAVGHVMRNGARPRVWAGAAVPVLVSLLIHLGYERWLIATGRIAMLPTPLFEMSPDSAPIVVRRVLGIALKSLPYVGVFTAPMVLCLAVRPGFTKGSGQPLRPNRTVLLGCLFAVAFFVGLVALGKLLPTFGNTLVPFGLGPLTLRDTFILHLNLPAIPGIVRAFWILASAVGVLAITALFGLAIGMMSRLLPMISRPEARRQVWAQSVMLVLFAVYFAGLFMLGAVAGVFDRYLIALIVPAVAFLVLERGRIRPVTVQWRSWRTVSCCTMLVLYAVFGTLGTHDYMAWNRARWQATASLLQAGIAPDEIDGGYEFNGWYLNSTTYEPKPDKSYWWVHGDEYVIASGPLDGYHQTTAVDVDRWLGLGPRAVVVLRRNSVDPASSD